MKLLFVTAIYVLTLKTGALLYGSGWDHFSFVQEWPQTTCLMGKEEGKVCSVPKYINSFIIHGLWPSSGSGMGPTNCRPEQHFNMNTIKNLTNELEHLWPNIYSNTPHDDFWKHEWTTHGTCALSLKATGTEYLYFRKTLDLMKTYNASRFLNRVNITPNDTTPYYTKTIETALQSKLKETPNLQCYKDKSGYGRSKNLLAEIRICMNKQFGLIDCPSTDSTLYWRRKVYTNPCYGGKIYFPEIRRN